MKRSLSIWFLLLFWVPARAQDVEFSLRPIPAEIGPGQGVFVEVEAIFPDTCTFGPGGELTFALNIVPDDRVDAFYRTPDPGACGDALTFARAVFGPLPFEWTGEVPQMEIGFTLERGDGLTGFGETAVNVADKPTAATPESGFWWNPALSGHGLSLDRQGRDLFGALFSYDDSGAPTWRVFQASVEGGLVATDLLGFVNGNCLLCSDSWKPPDQQEDKTPLHVAFDGLAQAWVRIGTEPGLAIGLQRFHLDPAAQIKATGIPVSVPDLTGSWIRIDGDGPDAIVHDTVVRIERLPERESAGEVVFGFFEAGGHEPTHTLVCAPDPFVGFRNCGFTTEVGDPGPPVYLAPSNDIGTERFEIEGLDVRFVRVQVRIEAPTE